MNELRSAPCARYDGNSHLVGGADRRSVCRKVLCAKLLLRDLRRRSAGLEHGDLKKWQSRRPARGVRLELPQKTELFSSISRSDWRHTGRWNLTVARWAAASPDGRQPHDSLLCLPEHILGCGGLFARAPLYPCGCTRAAQSMFRSAGRPRGNRMVPRHFSP